MSRTSPRCSRRGATAWMAPALRRVAAASAQREASDPTAHATSERNSGADPAEKSVRMASATAASRERLCGRRSAPAASALAHSSLTRT